MSFIKTIKSKKNNIDNLPYNLFFTTFAQSKKQIL